ncbi:MAG: hypothetical protein ACE5EM_08705 [Sphingomonadales bacterium]
MHDPYVVLRIDSVEKPAYEKFEVESEQQQLIEDLLDEGIGKELSGTLTDTAAAAVAFRSVGSLVKTSQEGKTLPAGAELEKARARFTNELAKLPADVQGTIGELLKF